MSKAVYAGTFDPITKGHLDVIERGSKMFNELIIAVADNPSKKPLLTKEERVDLLKKLTTKWTHVSVDSFEGLLINYVRTRKTNVILRGIRTISDFEYEFQMALTNRALAPDIETIFVMPCEKYSYISSRLIKEIVNLGGNVDMFVPKETIELMKKKSQE